MNKFILEKTINLLVSPNLEIRIILGLLGVLLFFIPLYGQDFRLTNNLFCLITSGPDSIIYVHDNNTSGPWLGTQSYPFQNIPEGLAAADSGVTVVVLPGNYLINQNLNVESYVKLFLFNGDTLRFNPGFGLDVEGKLQAFGHLHDSIYFTSAQPGHAWSGIHFINSNQVSEMRLCVVEHASDTGAYEGGAIYCLNSSLKLFKSYIRYNQTNYGAGIYCDSSSVLELTRCLLSNNSAQISGGAIYGDQADSLVFTQNVFFENSSTGSGGAIALINSISSISDNQFRKNSSGSGGAVYFENMSLNYLTFTWNQLDSNIATNGGALYIINSDSIEISRNLIIHNTAGFGGGCAVYNSDLDFINNTVYHNHATVGVGGLFTYQGNSEIVNNIIWGNIAANATQVSGTGLTLSYNDIEGGYAGIANISLYPMFVDTVLNDLHLSYASPCINTGDPGSLYDPDTTRADIGVYYHHSYMSEILVSPDSLIAVVDSAGIESLDMIISNSGNSLLLYSLSTELEGGTQSVSNDNIGMVTTFDGNGDYVKVPDHDSLDLNGNQMCVEAWVNINSYAGDYRCILGKIGWTTTSAWSYNLHINDGGGLHFNVVNTSGTEFPINSPAVVGNGTWHHVAATYNGSLIKIYIDGNEVNSRTATGNIRQNSYEIHIGAWYTSDPNYFKGEIDEVRIWNRSRTQQEIQSTMFTPLTGNEYGLVGYWHFNGSFFDITGNGNHGTPVGNATLIHPAVPITNTIFTYSSTDVPKSVGPLAGAVTESEIEITDGFLIGDLDITIDLVHTYDADLTIELISPKGTSVLLSAFNGAGGDNYQITIFNDEASTDITAGTPPYNGTYTPVPGPLSLFDGESVAGTWTLKITDHVNGDGGTLNSWSLGVEQFGVPWIHMVPMVGDIFPSGSENIAVDYVPNTLNPGDYFANILVTSNDPVTPLVVVPTKTTILGYPNLYASCGDTLDFGKGHVGTHDTLMVKLFNFGTAELSISDIVSTDAVFSVDQNQFTIPAASLDTLRVIYSPVAADTSFADLIFTGNFPPESFVVTGYSILGPDIEINADSLIFVDTLYVGLQDSLEFLIANTGFTNLIISDIISSNPVFSVWPVTQTISPYDTVTVRLFFNPDTTATETGILTILNNDETHFVFVKGYSLRPPVINLSDSEMFEAINVDNSLSDVLTISNDGFSDLHYEAVLIDTSDYIASFDGSGDYLLLGNPASLQINGNQTIEFWIKPINFSARRNPYAKAYGGEGTITIETNGTVNYYYGTSGANATPDQTFTMSSPLQANIWTHLAIVRDLENMVLKWYKDGTLINTATALYPQATASSLPAYIGHGYVNDIYGYLDEVRVWNIARSPQEISSSMRKNMACYTPGLAGYWNFGRTNPWYDLSGNGNSGQPQGNIHIDKSEMILSPSWADIVSNSEGTVNPSGSMDIDLQFNAVNIIGGVYNSHLRITSNDPFNSEIFVPVTLDAAGIPVISTFPFVLDFGTIYYWQSKELYFEVTNTGTDSLFVTGISSGNPDFTTLPSSFGLAVDSSEIIAVTYLPSSPGSDMSELIFLSNAGSFDTLDLNGYALDPPVIAVNPTSITDTVLIGDVAKQTMVLSNNGGSDLQYHLSEINYGNGSDGELNVSVTETYYVDAIKSKVNGLNPAGQNIITLNNAIGFAPDDEILIITMQDPETDTSLNKTGQYETHYIYSVTGNQIKLKDNLIYTYEQTSVKKHQVIRIPQFTDVIVEGTITCDGWNGETGGIVFFRSNGSVAINSTAKIDVTGKGYRGGIGPASQTDYQYGYAGERTRGVSTARELNGLAKIQGGGGAGKGAEGSGGGGGYGLNGGNGGKYLAGSDYGRGALSFGSANLNKLFFGGGGGSSGSHSAGRYGVAGGNGGGIVCFSVKTIIISNGGNIKASGNNGSNGIRVYDANSGAGGGGGAGGSILISADIINNDAGYIKAEAGTGGLKAANSNGYNGGGGGVGRIRFDVHSFENDGNINPNPIITSENVLEPWITVSPAHGIIPPSQKDTINISLLGYLLNVGDHFSQIKVQSNDIETAILSVPVNLKVNPGVGIFAADSIIIDPVHIDSVLITPFLIHNVGSITLTISDINLDDENAVFSLSDTTFTIPPFNKDTLWITFQPDSARWYEASLQILSNDPTDPAFPVIILGNGISEPVIAVSPDSFDVIVPQFDSITQNLTIFNNGGSNLEFNIKSIDNLGIPYVDPALFEFKTIFNGHRYYLSKQTSYWDNAKNTCQNWGGHLATISSSSENAIIQQIAVNKGATVWIGFSDYQIEGTWTWVTGEPVTYTNWASGEPNNGGGNEDYGQMYGTGSNIGKWNDGPDALLYYILEIDKIKDTIITFHDPSGIIPRYDHQDIDVTFHSRNLDFGTYYSNIQIISNDLTHDTLMVPATINIPPSNVAVLPDSFNVIVPQYDSLIQNLTIYNNGGSDLSYQLEYVDTTGWGAGMAVSFDGNGDYVQIPDNTLWDLGVGDFTIELWVNYSNISSYNTIIEIGNWTNSIIIRQDNSSQLFIYMWNTSYVYSFTPILNKWYDFAIRRKAGQLEVFVDGVQLGSSIVCNHNIQISNVIRIGSSVHATGQYFNGKMDEVRIWNYARTLNEIQNQIIMSLTGNEIGLIGYWNFNKNNPWEDISGNGNNGSAFGNTSVLKSTAPMVSDLITFNPQVGEVLLYDSLNIELIFHSYNLDFNTHSYTIRLINNDPSSDTINIPVILTVPPPDIDLAPLSISENLKSGDTLRRTFTISNSGLSNLIYDIEDIEGPGYAMMFDGSGDYMNIGDQPELAGMDSLTVECWIKRLGAGHFEFISKHYRRYSLFIDANNKFGMYKGYDGTNYQTFTSNYNLPLNEWHHLAVTWTGTTIKFYADGELVGSSTTANANPIPSTGYNFQLGRRADENSYYLNGYLDEVRVWSIYKTQAQIRSKLHSSLIGNENGLMGYWNFNQINPWDDISTANNDGVPYGNVAPVSSTAVITNMMSLDNISGLVNYNDSTSVECIIDASNLWGGQYHSSLTILNNTPEEDSIYLPIEISVTDAPGIDISDDTLDFGVHFVNAEVSLPFSIQNIGSEMLEITITPPYSNVFSYTGNSSLTIQPGDTSDYTFWFIPDLPQIEEDSIIISSDDPTDPITIIHLRGTGIPAPEITLIPYQMDVSVSSRNIYSENLIVKNTGGDSLEYNFYLRTKSDPDLYRYAYVVNYYSNSLSIIDLETNYVTNKTGFTTNPHNVEMTPDGQNLWITTANGTNIIVYNPWTGTSKTIPVTGTLRYGTAFSTDGNLAYVANQSNNRIEVFNTLTNSLAYTYSFNIDNPSNPDVTKDGNLLYIPDEGTDKIVIVNTQTGEHVTSLSGFTDPWWVRISPNGKWFAFRDGNTVKIGETESNAVVDNIPSISNPRIGVWSPDNEFFYVGSWDNYKIYKIETDSFTVIKEYTLPYRPFSVNLTGDNQYLLAACADDDKVAIIKLDTDEINYVTVQDYPTIVTTFRIKEPLWILGISRRSGILKADSSDVITIEMNTNSLDGGDYFAELPFTCNVPLENEFIYDINLNFNSGVARLHTSTDTLDFNNVWAGYPDSTVITFYNIGTKPLQVSSVSYNPNQFYSSANQLTVAPNNHVDVTVYCNAINSGTLNGIMTIFSNGGNKTIYLKAFVQSPPLISVNPAQISKTLLPDTTGSVNLTLFNNGSGDLTYNAITGMNKDIFIIGNNNKEQITLWNQALNITSNLNLISTGPWKCSYSPDGKKVWITYEDYGYITVIDLASNSVLANIYVEGSRTSDIAFNQEGSLAYICNWSLNRIEKINAINLSLEGNFSGSLSNPGKIISVPGTNDLYVMNYGNNNLIVFDMTSNTLVKTISGTGTDYDVIVSKEGDFVYWVDGGYVKRINTVTRSVEQTSLQLGDLRGAVLSDDGQIIYVCVYNQNKVIELETNNLTVLNAWSAWDVINKPIDISISFDKKYLFVILESDNKVVKIDIDNNSLQQVYSIGSSDFDFTSITASERISWLACEVGKDTLTTGNKLINFNFNTENLALGSYSAQYGIYSNSPVQPEIILPVELIVQNLGNLPPGWEFTVTPRTHNITIPSWIWPAIEGQPLVPGDYIGVFYMNNGTELCGGAAEWIGNSNLNIIAYGDNFLTYPKDGFSDGEDFIWKLYSQSSGQSCNADAVYDINQPEHDGKWIENGLSALTGLNCPVIPYQTNINNITLVNGQTQCYNAMQTIIVAGPGTYFEVQNGANAIFIAGQKISFLSGTTVHLGGYLHGYITPSGPWCNQGGVFPQVDLESRDSSKRDIPLSRYCEETFFKVYPNPTTWSFTLELSRIGKEQLVHIEIYSMCGEKIFTKQFTGERKQEFSLSNQPSGIYYIRVIAGDKVETGKIIKL